MSEELTDLQLAVHAARESLEPAYIEAGYLKVCLSVTDHAELIHHLRQEELFLHDIDPEGWAEIPKPALFFENINELFRKPQRRRNEPDRDYYLLDVNWLSTEQEPPLVVERWRDACHFLELAGEVADHQVERQNELELVFLHQEKLVVEVVFSSSDLVPLACLDELESEFLRSDTHREKKVSIFRSVLTERYKGRGRVQFGELLRDFF
ncbi:hypothetical protein [Halomonas piscis]|uniref:hypothetical protein n=1 Tax=Halomonas piscis TaxID=3031727 RepID=UPI00289DAEB0|nr:hypothetical protein [Halomonas piscis]